eukprot:25577-Eustigmatos_ZCMA.PRE.1
MYRPGHQWESSLLRGGDGGLRSCSTLDAVHNFLDAFYLSRIGIRMLIGQYLELRKPPRDNYIGLVSLVRLGFSLRSHERWE